MRHEIIPRLGVRVRRRDLLAALLVTTAVRALPPDDAQKPQWLDRRHPRPQCLSIEERDGRRGSALDRPEIDGRDEALNSHTIR
jgi:hypothetical protein